MEALAAQLEVLASQQAAERAELRCQQERHAQERWDALQLVGRLTSEAAEWAQQVGGLGPAERVRQGLGEPNAVRVQPAHTGSPRWRRSRSNRSRTT